MEQSFLIGTWSFDYTYDGEDGAGWKSGDSCKATLEFYEGGTGRLRNVDLVSNKGTDLPTTWEIKDGNIVNVTYSNFSGGDTTIGVKADLDAETLTRVDNSSSVYKKEQ